ncbi:transcription elongation protein SprT [Haloarcula sp. Atlit-7R]|uniref:transcription elongation protein SprT n=1 Tax=Haloarcula sp. Atlit-7R TaxID=2282125 RepID=UPI000EF13E20|nr:transcription elongation protein SprT [Haloarcula sp. Atlit-7R]RLM97298.1 transcription elongation protein SprT [Haloarcula sp. Atlit-7R]
MAETVSYEGIKSDSDLIAWSRGYCQRVRSEYGVSVRFDLVDWEVSHRAKRRAAAVKRPKLDDAVVGERYDWSSIDGSDGRPLRCTVSLTRDAFSTFDRDTWEMTLRHELIHVEQYQRDGTTDHSRAFRERADRLAADVHCPVFTDPKYVLSCGACGGLVARRYQDCKLVEQRQQYRSDCCGASLKLG